MTSGLVRTARATPSAAGQESERLRAQLQRYLAAERASEHERVVEIAELRRSAAGLSRETWLFDLHVEASGEGRVDELVLRRDPEGAGGLLDTDRETELGLLRRLEASTIPTPVVLHADLTGEHLDRPSLVLRRDRGTCDYLILNGDQPLGERLELAHAFCDLLAQLHREDWRALGVHELLPDPGAAAALVALDQWAATLRRHGPGAYPELKAAELWLRSWAPISPRTVLVHGDFKPGNALVEGRHISVLLDWETAHLGDPVEDLGWVTQPLRSEEHAIRDAWEPEDLLRRYTAATGLDVDPEALRWWQLFASYKTAVIQLTGLGAYVRGTGDRLFREPAACLRLLLTAMQREGG